MVADGRVIGRLVAAESADALCSPASGDVPGRASVASRTLEETASWFKQTT